MNFSPSLRGPVSAGLRLAAFFGWSLAIIAAWLLVTHFLGHRRRLRWAALFTSAWGRGTLRALGVRLHRSGLPPAPPFLLVANHLGYLDIAVLAAEAPCAFVAKREVSSWPLFGLLAKLGGSLFINRQSPADARRVNALIGKRLADGGALCLFPEGTSTGGDVLPFRSPLLEHPASALYPVHYAAIRYRTPADLPPASQAMCWWGDMPFASHFLNLFRQRGMEAMVVFGPAPVRADDRKLLSAKLCAGVRELLGYAGAARPRAHIAAPPVEAA